MNDGIDNITSNSRGSSSLPAEQTEPLDLCLGGTMKGLRVVAVDCYSEFIECGNVSEGSDDDVIFVKEFKEEKRRKPLNSKKSASVKGVPRRNPVRRARNTRRFKDFTDISFEESDFPGESDNESDRHDESAQEPLEENTTTKKSTADSEEWNMQSGLRRTRQKRKKIAAFKYTRMGRRRRGGRTKNVTETEREQKVGLKDLENVMEENLILALDYVRDIKFLCGNEDSGRTDSASEILKQQVILLAVVKDIADIDVLDSLKK